MEDALVLARTSSHVTLIHRGSTLRASHTLAQRVLSHPKISVRFETTVSSFEGDADGRLTHASLQTGWGDTKPHETWRLEVAAAFIAIGHTPNTALLASSGAVKLTSDGYIDMSASGRSSRTSVEGVFAAGDVADPTYRQVTRQPRRPHAHMPTYAHAGGAGGTPAEEAPCTHAYLCTCTCTHACMHTYLSGPRRRSYAMPNPSPNLNLDPNLNPDPNPNPNPNSSPRRRSCDSISSAAPTREARVVPEPQHSATPASCSPRSIRSCR
jgi:hypothetical protein